MTPTQAGRRPARIIVIRHAEKTGIPDDRELSPKGKLRAAVLASALPAAFGQIHVVVAAKSTERSARPQRTVEPLAIELGLGVEQRWGTKDYSELAAWLSSDSTVDGKQVLVCWRHKTLAQLAWSLGADTAPVWPESEYDWIWVIEPQNDIVKFRALNQKLDGKELTIQDQS